MENRTGELVRRVLELVSLTEVAAGTGRGYSTLQAYKAGTRNPSSAAAREIAAYLRDRAEEFSEIADALEAAADERSLGG